MSTDLEYIANLVEPLVSGFDERIEYDLRVVTHTEDCRASRPTWAECDCPSTLERRVKTVRHAPLIAQLQAAIAAPATADDHGGRSATRVESPFPGNLDALDLSDEIKRTVRTWVRRARAILGYDVPPSSIVRGAVCGECAGALKLHNGSAVCIGRIGESPPCGMEYTWQQIEDYYRGLNEQVS
ncbi:DUF7341 domain-containing protein [Streptomyces sp. KR55]|uniref:DUF7341 domain-containing protein n=1 Tax=Streptomyces sp. KR55 TaxID=3457425 RepID=UPI003FD21BD5